MRRTKSLFVRDPDEDDYKKLSKTFKVAIKTKKVPIKTAKRRIKEAVKEIKKDVFPKHRKINFGKKDVAGKYGEEFSSPLHKHYSSNAALISPATSMVPLKPPPPPNPPAPLSVARSLPRVSTS